VVLFSDAPPEADPIAPSEPEEQPLLAPVTPGMSWDSIHAMSQTPLRAPVDPIVAIRRTATIRRGTRMIKLLSKRQLAAYLHGRRPSGFCYREHDLSLLRNSADMSLLIGDANRADASGQALAYGLRWRAIDPADYDIPFAAAPDGEPSYAGLRDISPHDRLGPPVLGTGFAPSQHHLVPEFVTADLADLPMPAGTSLVAFTPDGAEVTLYLYIPEQRAWTRMFGPHYRHLMSGMPEVATEQEYVQSGTDHFGGSTLLGRYRGDTYETVADPPHEFRVLAKARAARYAVDTVARRTRYTRWRDVDCSVVRIEGDWVRLRPTRPDRGTPTAISAQCVERGIYETWAPVGEIAEIEDRDHIYAL
jgi:hypothetical protein